MCASYHVLHSLVVPSWMTGDKVLGALCNASGVEVSIG
jgi:hypothetical protein